MRRALAFDRRTAAIDQTRHAKPGAHAGSGRMEWSLMVAHRLDVPPAFLMAERKLTIIDHGRYTAPWTGDADQARLLAASRKLSLISSDHLAARGTLV
jgi:hypothetical protein